MKGEFGKFVWKTYQCFESYDEMQNTFRRWKFWIELENVLQKYDMILVYYYFSFLGCVSSQKLLNPMKKTFCL
jgi:hypothetical protein